MKKIIAIFSIFAILTVFSACTDVPPKQSESSIPSYNTSSTVSANNSSIPKRQTKTVVLSKTVSADKKIKSVSLKGNVSNTAADFAVKLFQSLYNDEQNVIISPLSVLTPLAMVANGAEGETLRQMEEVLGADRDTLNQFIFSYLKTIKKSPLSMAQSVWVCNQFDVKESFLKTNANYYDADIFSADISDKTVNEINKWIRDKTDGEIENAINNIHPNTVALLINSILFDAKWQEKYSERNQREGTFYNMNGSKGEADFLYSTENLYLEGDNFTGFIKPYSDERFAFMALLPNSNSSLKALIESLDGQKFASIMNAAEHTKVSTSLPEFEIEFKEELSKTLIKMGIEDAFSDTKADLSSLAPNTYISSAIHSAKIEVDADGTKAAATTIVATNRKSASSVPQRAVYLNRPFVYAIIDTEADIPAFIGTVTSLGD